MKKVALNDCYLKMLEKAIRCMISNLQYERHQALVHNCSAGDYNREIEQYRQLKEYIEDARTKKD